MNLGSFDGWIGCCGYESWKFNGWPLNIYRDPKGKACLPTFMNFRGELLNFRGVVLFLGGGEWICFSCICFVFFCVLFVQFFCIFGLDAFLEQHGIF